MAVSFQLRHVKDFERDGITWVMLSVDLVRMQIKSFCDCTVTFDDQICDSCTVVKDEASRVGLREFNAEAVTTECQAINFDLSLNGVGNRSWDFHPPFRDSVVSWKPAIDDRISCDCNDGRWYL
jgi:hypothetical protein